MPPPSGDEKLAMRYHQEYLREVELRSTTKASTSSPTAEDDEVLVLDSTPGTNPPPKSPAPRRPRRRKAKNPLSTGKKSHRTAKSADDRQRKKCSPREWDRVVASRTAVRDMKDTRDAQTPGRKPLDTPDPDAGITPGETEPDDGDSSDSESEDEPAKPTPVRAQLQSKMEEDDEADGADDESDEIDTYVEE